MIGGVLIEFGWCGFGCAGGLFPELRAGVIRVCCYRGSIFSIFGRTASALRLAVLLLRREGPATEAGRGPAFASPPCAGDAKALPASFEGNGR